MPGKRRPADRGSWKRRGKRASGWGYRPTHHPAGDAAVAATGEHGQGLRDPEPGREYVYWAKYQPAWIWISVATGPVLSMKLFFFARLKHVKYFMEKVMFACIEQML